MASKKVGSKESSGREKLQVLVVDGDPAWLERMENTLGRWYDVRAFNKAADFLKKTEDLKPDLIVIDWQMPEMTGVAISHEIRKSRRLDRVPIAFSSAADPSEDELGRALKAGGQAFLFKGCESGFLLAQCREMIENSQMLSSLLRQRSMVIAALKHDLLDTITGVTAGVEVLAMQKRLFNRGFRDQAETLLDGTEQLRNIVTALSDLLITDCLHAELPAKQESLTLLFEDLATIPDELGREITFHTTGSDTACFHRESMASALSASLYLLHRFVPIEIPFHLATFSVKGGTRFEISAEGKYGRTLKDILEAVSESPDRHEGPGLFYLMQIQSVLARHQSTLETEERDGKTALVFTLTDRIAVEGALAGEHDSSRIPICHPELVRSR